MWLIIIAVRVKYVSWHHDELFLMTMDDDETQLGLPVTLSQHQWDHPSSSNDKYTPFKMAHGGKTVNIPQCN